MTILEESNEDRRAARLAAFMVINEDERKASEKMKASMNKQKHR